MNNRRPDARKQQESGPDEIERRFIDEQAEGEQEIIDEAAEASERTRREPDSAERRERSFGVEDPSHSRGSTRRRS